MIKIKWKYEVGDRIVDYKKDGTLKRNLTVVNRKIQTKQNKKQIVNEKWYQCKCNVCEWIGWKSESKLHHRKSGCLCCQNQMVVKGINDLATTAPDLIKYFDDISDTYKYTKASDQQVSLHCPTCNYKKKMPIKTLYRQGFSCPICEDGYSYPEKLMHAVLRNINIDYKYQLNKKHFSWCKEYRYDFYLPGYNCIIEVHGPQHYERPFSNGRNQKEEYDNDKIKKALALKNGIQNYIIIDARISNLLFIKKSILKSNLAKLLDLEKVDWSLSGEQAESSLVIDVCKYYKLHKNDDYCISIIAGYFNISKSCVCKYLKRGRDIGICDYDPKEMQKKVAAKNGKIHTKTIYVYDSNYNFICKYKGITEFVTHSVELIGIKTERNGISKVCHGKSRSYKGYIFSFEELDIKNIDI